MNRYQSRKSGNRILRAAAFTLAGALTMTSLAEWMPVDGIRPAAVQAIESRQTVTYEYYTRTLGNTVPASWLFVGTYLMSAKAITPQLYQEALASRVSYDQPIAYYTSELDNGEWKNVEGAGSISTILPVSGKVKEETLYPYLVTVVVSDDGIPRDPITKEPVDVFTLTSPYEMENIPELNGLQDYYESGRASTNTDVGSYYYGMLNTFFEYDNLEDYDRTELNIVAAYDEYKRLTYTEQSADTQINLESVWDMAWSQEPDQYAEEYRDLMILMRNWPNIRDDFTDRMDIEEETVNALYLSLKEQELEEEGDAALSVLRQIDAMRRAEIYYNLTENEGLFANYGNDTEADLDEWRIRQGEVTAKLAQTAIEVDRAEAKVLALRDEIAALTEENEKEQVAIDAENEGWDAAWQEEMPDSGLTPEEAVAARQEELNRELARLQELLAPYEEEYHRRNQELNEVLQETVDYNAEQQALAAEMDSVSQDTSGQIEIVEAHIQELEGTLAELQARQAAARKRRGEYDAAVARTEELNEKLSSLETLVEKEQEKLEQLTTEAEGYTTNRFTAAFDKDKTYDPDRKYELDTAIAAQEKLINSLGGAASSVVLQLEEANRVIEEVEPDLDLEAEIQDAQTAVNEEIPLLMTRIVYMKEETANEVGRYEEQLAAMSQPYQEKLGRLSEANARYEEAEAAYLEAKERVDAVQAELDDLTKRVQEHERIIQKHERTIENNLSKIAIKETNTAIAQEPVDSLNQEVTALQAELEAVTGMLEDASTGTVGLDKKAEAIRLRLESATQEYDSLETSWNASSKQRESDLEAAEQALKERDAAAEELKEQQASLNQEYEEIAVYYDSLIADLYTDMDQRLREHAVILSERRENDEQLAALLQSRKETEDQLALASDYSDSYKRYTQAASNAAEEQSRLAYYQRQKQWVEDDLNSWLAYYCYSYRRNCEWRLSQLEPKIAFSETYLNNLKDRQNETLSELEELEARAGQEYGLSLAGNRKYWASNWYAECEEQYQEVSAAIDRRIADRDQELADEEEAFTIAIQKEVEAQRKAYEEERAEQLRLNAETYDQLTTEYTQMIGDYDRAYKELTTSLQQTTDDYQAQMTELSDQITYYQELLESIETEEEDILSFGPSPSLYFLRDAAVNGHTEIGRNYEAMSNDSSRKDAFVSDTELVELIDTAIEDCKTAGETYQTKTMRRGEWAAEYTGYILSRQVSLKAADQEAAMPYLQMLVDLDNVENTQIVHATRELSLIYGWLLPFAMRDFLEEKSDAKVDDYQYYIRCAADRDTIENAIIFVEGRLEYANSLRSTFAAEDKTELLEAHITWLENLLRSLRDKQEEDSDESYSSGEQNLLDEKQQAIDEGNLVRARQIDELLKGLMDSGDASESSENGKNPSQDDLTPSDYPISARPSPDQEIRDLILGSIAIKNYRINEDLDRYIAADGDLGELAEELENTGAPPEYVDEVRQADVEEKKKGYEYGGSLDPDTPESTPNFGENEDEPGPGGTPRDGGAGGTGGGSVIPGPGGVPEDDDGTGGTGGGSVIPGPGGVPEDGDGTGGTGGGSVIPGPGGVPEDDDGTGGTGGGSVIPGPGGVPEDDGTGGTGDGSVIPGPGGGNGTGGTGGNGSDNGTNGNGDGTGRDDGTNGTNNGGGTGGSGTGGNGDGNGTNNGTGGSEDDTGRDDGTNGNGTGGSSDNNGSGSSTDGGTDGNHTTGVGDSIVAPAYTGSAGGGTSGNASNGGGAGGDGSGAARAGNRGNRSGMDTGSDDEHELSQNEVQNLIADYYGEPIEELPDKEQAAALAAVEIAAENTDNTLLAQNSSSLLEELLGYDNPLIYRQYMDDRSTEYVSLGAVDKNRRLTRFRYVKERKENQTTMTMIGGGSASYTFTVGDTTVVKNNGTSSKLDKAAVEQADQYIRNTHDTMYTYISEADAKLYLDVTCVYIDGTDWAILVTSGKETEVAELASIIEQALGSSVVR